MDNVGFYVGISLFFILLFVIGVSSILEGIKGIRGKKMELILKDNYIHGDRTDSTKGNVGYVWGVVYILFGFLMLGLIGAVVWLVLNSVK